MQIVTSKSEIEQLLQSNDMILVYFSGNNCSVCRALKPKVNELFKKFSNIKVIEIEVENSTEVSAQYNIFTVPAILLFIEGKEVIKELRHISLHDLENKISRYYRLFY